MTRTITIDPVTRIEGHARVFLNLAADGSLESAGLVVNELRGFERILVGMEADRMPLITARICGVCPSAHHLAACKALDHAAGVEPPPAGKLLRELLYMGHVIHSHALSLFVLQGPDLIMGVDADPAVRNVVGMVKAYPDLAKKALECRTLGQKINELVGGRGIHPVTCLAGGISFRLDSEKRATLERWTRDLVPLAVELTRPLKDALRRQVDRRPALMNDAVLPMWSLGTVRNGRLNLYDGALRAVDAAGQTRLEFPAAEFNRHLVESAVPWSYMKPVHIAVDGEACTYRVGPLARLNAAGSTGTPLADEELRLLRETYGRPAHHTIAQIHARAVELIYAAERAREIVADPGIMGETRVPVKFRGGRGAAHVEAARGALFHDYEIDENGIVRAANLLVATQQNFTAINRSIEQAAGPRALDAGDDRMLNAVEFAIRCYDPCLSCATHALGQMPLEIVMRRDGQTIRRIGRGV